LLCANDKLSVVKFAAHELLVGELREEDEVEWDSEEYTDVEAIIIAEFVKNSSTLKRLDLARNQISDEGGIALAAALRHNNVLEYLNLESNNLSGVSAQRSQRTQARAQRAHGMRATAVPRSDPRPWPFRAPQPPPPSAESSRRTPISSTSTSSITRCRRRRSSCCANRG
jgi:hypothetical protein